MDILLDEETGDIPYDNANTPQVTQDLNTDLSQRLRIKLQTYLGEWFLNNEKGVPYFETVFRKGVQKPVIDLIFQQQIIEEPDVLEITSFTSTLDATRKYSLSFRVKTYEGFTDIITVGG